MDSYSYKTSIELYNELTTQLLIMFSDFFYDEEPHQGRGPSDPPLSSKPRIHDLTLIIKFIRTIP